MSNDKDMVKINSRKELENYVEKELDKFYQAKDRVKYDSLLFLVEYKEKSKIKQDVVYFFTHANSDMDDNNESAEYFESKCSYVELGLEKDVEAYINQKYYLHKEYIGDKKDFKDALKVEMSLVVDGIHYDIDSPFRVTKYLPDKLSIKSMSLREGLLFLLERNKELWSESCGILMTEDKKCVLRGCNKYSQILTLVDEDTKFKIKKWRSSKNLEKYVNSSRLLVSDKVKEIYGLENKRYNEEKMGKLISVKLEATYKIL